MKKPNKYPELLLTHWATLIEGFEYSPKEFYDHLQEALNKREIPGIENETIEFPETGPLSVLRQYFRITREGFIYDVCAAQFGSGFFVSYRLGVEPIRLNIFHAIVPVIAVMAGYLVPTITAGLIKGGFSWLGFLIGCACSFGIVFALIAGLSLGHAIPPVDWILMRVPFIKEVYQRFFRPDTYYRTDVALMFKSATQGAIMEAVDTMTKAKGHRGLTPEERKPLFDNMFGHKTKKWKRA